MRATYRKHCLSLAVLLTPLLLASCGTNDAGTGGGTLPSGLTLPDCADGQLLGSNGTALVCVNAPVANLATPAGGCDATTGALNSDGTAVTCVTKASGNLDSQFQSNIDTYTKQINDLTASVTIIQNGGGAQATYVGTTTQTTNGAVKDAAGNVGISAASALCAAQFDKGAKVCTPYDIYQSIVRGKITTATQIPVSWIYAANWKTPVASPTEPLNGLNDNCAGFTYPTGDQKWTGTVLRWEQVTFTGRFAPKFQSGIGCSTLMPLACCK